MKSRLDRCAHCPGRAVVGGTSVTLREFSLTSAVVFTADLSATGLVVKFQERQRSMAKLAAQYAHDQAQEELAKVEKINAELEQAGHRLPDAAALLAKTRAYLESCDVHRRDGRHGEAYAEAQRAVRPLRILMRAQWEAAVRPLSIARFQSLCGQFLYVAAALALRRRGNADCEPMPTF